MARIALAAAYAFVWYIVVAAPAYAIPNAGGARQMPAEATKPARCRTVIRDSSERRTIHTKDGRTLPLVVLRPIFNRVCW